MNILFLTMVKINSIKDNGLYSDLLRFFKESNHNLYIVTPYEKKYDKKTKLIADKNVFYLRVRTGNFTKVNIIEKGISTLLIEHQFYRTIQKYLTHVHFDLILYSTPPITFYGVVKRLKQKYNSATYLMLKDIFPQNAVDLMMFPKNGFLHKYFKYKEKLLYNISDYIGTMSKKNSEFLINQYPELVSKIEMLPNTITPYEINISEMERQKTFEKYAIPIDKRIFIYGGNLGKPQGIDFLIECLRANEANKNSFFIIVGSGTEFYKLENFFGTNNIKNARLIKQLPKEEYESLANSCDVGLIFLDYRFTIPNFPSRLLSYMQASMPVIAATDPHTDVGDVIESGNFGRKVMSNDVEAFNKVINEFAIKDDLKELGMNARKYLEDHYTTEVAYNTIMKHFE